MTGCAVPSHTAMNPRVTQLRSVTFVEGILLMLAGFSLRLLAAEYHGG